MIITTTPSIEGHKITTYRGVIGDSMLMVSVSGTAVVID